MQEIFGEEIYFCKLEPRIPIQPIIKLKYIDVRINVPYNIIIFVMHYVYTLISEDIIVDRGFYTLIFKL